MIVVRAVFSLAVLVLAGVLVVALFAHLGSRYQEETAALGFGGIYERLASQAGFLADPSASRAFVEAEQAPLLIVREAAPPEE
jgi:hypothetical protein